MVDSVISKMSDVWGEIRERQKRRELEESEIYKRKGNTHEMETEEEENEEELKEMFEDHLQDFSDLMGEKTFVSAEEDDVKLPRNLST